MRHCQQNSKDSSIFTRIFGKSNAILKKTEDSWDHLKKKKITVSFSFSSGYLRTSEYLGIPISF